MSSHQSPDVLDTPEYWLSTLGEAQPLYTSLPTPGAKHELAACEKVAGALGLKLLPWQRFFLRVVTEKLPNGDYRFSSCLLTVSRQSGKSTVLQILAVTRALLHPQTNVYYTAQTNMDAFEAIILTLAETVKKSVIGKTVEVRRSNTSPGIRFNNGSLVAPFTPSPEGLHGKTSSLIILDEIFKWSQTAGDLLMGAAAPTTITKGGKAQILMMSTKGTSSSQFLNGKIELGRVAASDPDSRMCFMEWAMAPGLDPMDLNNYGFHPGYAGGLITLDAIRGLSIQLSAGEFKRGMANVFTETAESVFDLKQWESLRAPLPQPEAKQVAYAYEISASRSAAAVCAAWKGVDGVINVKLIRSAAGTHWLLEDIPALKKTKPLAIGADRYAQNNVVTDTLTNAYPHLDLHTMSATEIGTASAAFLARVEDGTIRHCGSPALLQAIRGAVTRSFGDSGFAFSHNSSPELMAAVVAVRLVDQVKAKAKPFVMFAED